MLHDSFGTELVPFLADSFGRLEAWRWQDFDAARIDRERPDVVLSTGWVRSVLLGSIGRSRACGRGPRSSPLRPPDADPMSELHLPKGMSCARPLDRSCSLLA